MRQSLSSSTKLSFALACGALLPCTYAHAAPETSGATTSTASAGTSVAPGPSGTNETTAKQAPPAVKASNKAVAAPATPKEAKPTPGKKRAGQRNTGYAASAEVAVSAPAPAAPQTAASPVALETASGPATKPAPATEPVPATPPVGAAPKVQSTEPVPATPAVTLTEAPTASTPPTVASVSPPSARPLPPEAPLASYFDVGIVIQTNWNTASAYDFFSDDDVAPKGGLVLGVDVARVSSAVFGIDVNALFSETSSSGPLPQYISQGNISQTELGGGLTLRYELLRWLAPQLRIGGGVALQKAQLMGPDFGDLRQDVTTGYATLGGGLAFTTPAARLSRTRTYLNSLGLRVIVEGGYHLGQELEFTVKAKQANDDSATPNPIAATNLGVLPQSGPYVRLSVQARF